MHSLHFDVFLLLSNFVTFVKEKYHQILSYTVFFFFFNQIQHKLRNCFVSLMRFTDEHKIRSGMLLLDDSKQSDFKQKHKGKTVRGLESIKLSYQLINTHRYLDN